MPPVEFRASGDPLMSAGVAPLRKAVGAAFSSVSVLNASFRRVNGALGSTAESSGVDLLKAQIRPGDLGGQGCHLGA